MKDVEEWNKWLLDNKNIDVQMFYNEYLLEIRKKIITQQDVLNYLSSITNISLEVLTYKSPNRKSRQGSNKISRARGYLVKWVLLNTNIFTLKNVYYYLFGITRDHSTAIHSRDVILFREELAIYNKLDSYLKQYTIIWER